MRFILCTWFGEFCSCCSLTALPSPAWVLLNWICKELISSLYISNSPIFWAKGRNTSRNMEFANFHSHFSAIASFRHHKYNGLPPNFCPKWPIYHAKLWRQSPFRKAIWIGVNVALSLSCVVSLLRGRNPNLGCSSYPLKVPSGTQSWVVLNQKAKYNNLN